MGRELLLVDDDEVVLRMLEGLFRAHGFTVSTATSAKTAISMIEAKTLDLVVTDMRMETPTAGFEVIAAAKRQPSDPVVAILSAFPMTKAEWRHSGADAMFLKGTSTDRMLRDIEQLLRIRHQRAGSSRAGRRRKA